MPAIQASRRLVKSPPELWAEVSDAASLARHLGEVGEIRITRLEPETAVAWEGERASGTVELAPAGWGTSVTLTAEPVGEAAAAEPAPKPDSTPEPQPEPTAVAEPQLAPESIAAEPELAAEAAPEPARRSWLARLLRRSPEPALASEPTDADRAGGTAEDDSATPLAESPRAVTGPARSSAEPEPVAQAPAAPPQPDPLEDLLAAALDSLGAAHHRPFSRG
jgi:hypothetical protein